MTRRLTKPLDEWEASDVLALVEERIEEGQRLEYKRQLDLETPKKRCEVAKDVSGLANAQGGLLVYGSGSTRTTWPSTASRSAATTWSGKATTAWTTSCTI